MHPSRKVWRESRALQRAARAAAAAADKAHALQLRHRLREACGHLAHRCRVHLLLFASRALHRVGVLCSYTQRHVQRIAGELVALRKTSAGQ